MALLIANGQWSMVNGQRLVVNGCFQQLLINKNKVNPTFTVQRQKNSS